MTRIIVTGSADGLGRAAAETLLGNGHEVIVHARSAERLAPSTTSSAKERPPWSGTWPT